MKAKVATVWLIVWIIWIGVLLYIFWGVWALIAHLFYWIVAVSIVGYLYKKRS